MGIFDKNKNNRDLQSSNHKGSGFVIPKEDDNFDIPQLEASIEFEKNLIEQRKHNMEKLRQMQKRLVKYPKHVQAIENILAKEQRGLDDSRVMLNYLQGELEEEKAKTHSP